MPSPRVASIATLFGTALWLVWWSSSITMKSATDEGWGHPPRSDYVLETVKGFFLQDFDSTDTSNFDFIASNFGLANPAPEPIAWKAFGWSIQELNREAPEHVSYHVLYLGRHGEGWHNVAEAHYGTAAWDDYWSKLDGDGNMTWGPDALLTPTGEDQARAIAAAWTAPARAGVPVPTAFYTSPLTRAADTLALTFGRAGVVLERLRETNGVHTCDKRRPESWIAARAPGAVFEAGFTEEDELWEPDVRETDEAQQARIRDALVQILDNDASTYISITAHSGTTRAVLQVIGHRPFSLSPGAMIPVVIKATKVPMK